MSETERSEQRGTVFGIVTRASETKVLMRSNGQGFSLPSFTMEGGLWQTGAEAVTPGFQKLLSEDINILYRVSFREDEGTGATEAIYVIEDRSFSKNGCSWLDISQLEDSALARPEQQSIISAVVSQSGNGRIPVQRPPWARHGWYNKATGWIVISCKNWVI